MISATWGNQEFGVLVVVGVEHVDDEYRGVTHELVSTPSPDVHTRKPTIEK
jgi:hypothetical protein